MDEIYNMYFNVLEPSVVSSVEMFTDLTHCLVAANVIEMGLKTVHQSVLGLPYILQARIQDFLKGGGGVTARGAARGGGGW